MKPYVRLRTVIVYGCLITNTLNKSLAFYTYVIFFPILLEFMKDKHTGVFEKYLI